MQIQFGDEDLKARGQFLGLGTHTVSVTKVEKGQSQAGNPKLVVTFSDGSRERQEHFALTPGAKWKIANLAKACGFSEAMLKSKPLDPTMLVGRSLELVIEEGKTRVYQGKQVTDWNSYYNPLPEGMSAAGADPIDDIPF